MILDVVQCGFAIGALESTEDNCPACRHRSELRPERVLILLIAQHHESTSRIVKRIARQGDPLVRDQTVVMLDVIVASICSRRKAFL